MIFRHKHSRVCYDDPGPAHGSPFTVCNQRDGELFLEDDDKLKLATQMANLIVSFVENEISQTSYAEMRGSQSMDIPVEFLALCEFAEEHLGVNLREAV